MVPLAIKFFGCTKVLSINNFGPLFGKRGQRRIIVIHDVWFMSDTYEGSAIVRYVFGLLLRIQLLCVHEIITVSEFSRKEIAEKLGVAANRIIVVPNCLDEIDIAKTEAMTDSIAEQEYFLLIGSDRSNKNVVNAVRGFQSFNSRSTKKALLIVVGTFSKPFIESIVSRLNTTTAQRVQFRNYVERAELLTLISSAIGIVFPSLYEGYGIPVIEAIAYNKAVLVARNTVCEELAGPFGVVVDANSVDSIAKGFDDLIGKVDTVKITELSEYRAKFFGCERSAAIMSSILMQSGDLALT
jgi:glycosyltransferase involved in cell wall biosynthesis